MDTIQLENAAFLLRSIDGNNADKYHQLEQKAITSHLKASPTEPQPSQSSQPSEKSHNALTTPPKDTTIFYLAYGSNLCAETFLGKREIKPLSQMNVCVPTLKLTFDLAGIPYIEPCFANTALRDPANPNPPPPNAEKPTHPPYHKDRWHKPLVGVLYGLTPADYAHVIATEGGGAAYTDIVIPCFPLPPNSTTVPMDPTGEHVLGHTLFAPRPPGKPQPGSNHRQRVDPGYAQPSARYLKLITDGAAEHDMPGEYREYLAGIRPYVVATQRQRLGRFLFGSIWIPIFMLLVQLIGGFAGKDGRSPRWLARIMMAVFAGMWESYDDFFRGMFGDGERSLGDGGGGDEEAMI